MFRGIAGGLGLLLIVVGGIILGQGVGLIGGSFMTGHGRWAVTGAVMIAIGICLLAAGHVSRPGSEAMTELDEIRAESPTPASKPAHTAPAPANESSSIPPRGARGPLTVAAWQCASGPPAIRRTSAALLKTPTTWASRSP